MSPLKVEKETASFGKESFYVFNSDKYVIEFVGNKRVILHGSLFGGHIETIPDVRNPDQNFTVAVNPLTEPAVIIGRRRQDKENSTYTVFGVI
jgi:hypothetical protein